MANIIVIIRNINTNSIVKLTIMRLFISLMTVVTTTVVLLGQ